MLFFECVKLYPKKEKNILVLDDFITSLDIANRTSIIKYIFDNFRNFQILIFTHNVYFYNLITYMINEYYKSDKKLNNSKWSFTNLYEIENDHFIYEKGSNSFEELKSMMLGNLYQMNLEISLGKNLKYSCMKFQKT